MAPVYAAIPSLDQWQRDGSVAFAIRSHDPILDNIDKLQALRKPKAPYFGLSAASSLFFSVDYWLKTYPTDKRLDKERVPAVEALFKGVANFLCTAFQCTIKTTRTHSRRALARKKVQDTVGRSAKNSPSAPNVAVACGSSVTANPARSRCAASASTVNCSQPGMRTCRGSSARSS
jgi:hypothetical protein